MSKLKEPITFLIEFVYSILHKITLKKGITLKIYSAIWAKKIIFIYQSYQILLLIWCVIDTYVIETVLIPVSESLAFSHSI